jgi:tetratricopeptide (TPR) repeat protein
MEHVFGKDAPNLTPVVMCEDRVLLPVEGSAAPAEALAGQESKVPEWQRWNDYGIGLLLKGSVGSEKGELRQAEEVFRKVAELGRADGWLNLARVHEKEGRVDDAVAALRKAIEHPEPAPAWTVSWLTGRVNRQNGFLDEAIRNFEDVLATRVPERGFDFSLDYEVWNELGLALFDRSKRAAGDEERNRLLDRARAALERTIALDPENKDAHYNLWLIAARQGREEDAKRHLEAFHRYRPDDNAADRAIAAHRQKNPAANKAAQSIVIYGLSPAP